MKKRIGQIALVLLLLLLITGGYLLWAVNQVPPFYEELMAAGIEPSVRKAESKKFTQNTLALIDDVKQSRNWSHTFTQRQVNSWFIEELDGKFSDLMPPEAKDPRVKITGDHILLGFQYKHSAWDGVVSLKVKPWVPEPNQLALEIASVKAGSLPVPLDEVLKKIQSNFESRGWRVEWRQKDGNEVLLVDFSNARKKRSVLKGIVLKDGSITVSGAKP